MKIYKQLRVNSESYLIDQLMQTRELEFLFGPNTNILPTENKVNKIDFILNKRFFKNNIQTDKYIYVIV